MFYPRETTASPWYLLQIHQSVGSELKVLCTCVISWVVISIARSSSLLSSSVGLFRCLSWRLANSFIFCFTLAISYWIWNSKHNNRERKVSNVSEKHSEKNFAVLRALGPFLQPQVEMLSDSTICPAGSSAVPALGSHWWYQFSFQEFLLQDHLLHFIAIHTGNKWHLAWYFLWTGVAEVRKTTNLLILLL